MSASLVGSEMCIRDSSPDHQGPLKPFLRDTRSALHGGAWRSVSSCRAEICLLYTSDAADDM
eukprot:10174206-Alexandrium_andersonii.AAC.1